jgi:hypothetical protein
MKIDKGTRINAEYGLTEDFRTWSSLEFSELDYLPKFISVIIYAQSKKYLDGEQYNVSDINVDGFIKNNEKLLYDNIEFDRYDDSEKDVTVRYHINLKVDYGQYLSDKEFFKKNFKCSITLE